MRHRKKNNHLGRKTAHRKATLANLASSLILHKRINTTVAKAKALKVYVEPLITKSKLDSTHSRRVVFSYLSNKFAVSELFREVSQKVANRPGGYTRILKTGFRKGDGAEMCFIELVDYNLNMLKSAEESQQKRTRRGRARKQSEEETAATTAKESTTDSKTQADVAEEVKPEAKVEETAEPKKDETNTEAVAEELKPEANEETAKEVEKKEDSKEETEPQDVIAEKTEEKPQESESKESKDDEEKKAE